MEQQMNWMKSKTINDISTYRMNKEGILKKAM